MTPTPWMEPSRGAPGARPRDTGFQFSKCMSLNGFPTAMVPDERKSGEVTNPAARGAACAPAPQAPHGGRGAGHRPLLVTPLWRPLGSDFGDAFGGGGVPGRGVNDGRRARGGRVMIGTIFRALVGAWELDSSLAAVVRELFALSPPRGESEGKSEGGFPCRVHGS